MSKRWVFAESQKAELERQAKTHPKAYVRLRALAVYHVADGKTTAEAGAAVLAHRVSVGAWVRRYLESGMAGLLISSGRGKISNVTEEELEQYLRRPPSAFGVPRSRWTLRALAETVPSMKGMSEAGVMKVLARFGYAYKRGQPHLHSPDPDYEAKKGLWTKR